MKQANYDEIVYVYLKNNEVGGNSSRSLLTLKMEIVTDYYVLTIDLAIYLTKCLTYHTPGVQSLSEFNPVLGKVILR